MNKLFTIAILTAVLVPTLALARNGADDMFEGGHRSSGHSNMVGSGGTWSGKTWTGTLSQSGKMDDSLKGLHIAIGRLSAADRATLLTMIQSYLVSKGVSATGATASGTTASGTTSTGMTDQMKALHLSVGKLSSTDRAGLVTMISTYLTSKGITIPSAGLSKDMKDEVKVLKKKTKEELKEMRKKAQADMKAKREALRAKIKALRGDSSNDD